VQFIDEAYVREFVRDSTALIDEIYRESGLDRQIRP